MLHFEESALQKDVVCQNDFCCNYEIEVSTHKLPENSVSSGCKWILEIMIYKKIF